jgi:hypothetical protein
LILTRRGLHARIVIFSLPLNIKVQPEIIVPHEGAPLQLRIREVIHYECAPVLAAHNPVGGTALGSRGAPVIKPRAPLNIRERGRQESHYFKTLGLSIREELGFEENFCSRG